ncbi:elongation factor P-like protein YeiP [Sansalvadorimonas sp. 2012CJ34-2]|uniref:Elongation factor P-like protein n=1 Tax=Parendozoicomonas callyspongiae TaxID=2942213 RepID=A0ABT0PJQ3_9GAMM|nr:elongation factor P-like protein YeiP [Sansalvadorimonas sp. 2012CJ34-2]MCL6271622.1 elongation factor P-like protein YeiP [Sansalvadorimonas sp. 2012CJ34-2]
MPAANELKKGHIVEINGHYYQVKNVDAKSPSSRGAQTLYKIRFNQVPGGRKLEGSYTGNDQFPHVDLQRSNCSFLYKDGGLYTFMDAEDYTQHSLNESDLEGSLEYLQDGMEGIVVLVVDGQALAIELPQSVVMEVIETSPAIKGASAAARTKPARMATGLEVQVPEYLEPGERIKINTETGKFMSRA